MGNLVSNGLVLSGPREALIRALALMTPDEVDPLFTVTGTDTGTDGLAYVKFSPEILVPEPAAISATQDGQNVDIGLAALSTNGVNHLRIKQDRDPFLSGMPPAYQETADSILLKLGLETLRGDALLAAVEKLVPGALEAGRLAVAAHEETDEFGWYDWRKKHWGARAFAAEMRVEVIGDDLNLRFDSVNDAPVAWIVALAAACPDLKFKAASFDEDNDYSVIFELLDEVAGELTFAEGDDEDGVRRARALIGMSTHVDDHDNEEEIEP